MEARRSPGRIVKFLAGIFRGASFVVGISAPAREEDERRFVYLWLAMIGIVIIFFGLLFLVLSRMHL